MRRQNAMLRKNRMVLEEFLLHSVPVNHQDLLARGFREGYITQYIGPGHFRVYDMDMKQLSEDSWMIRRASLSH